MILDTLVFVMRPSKIPTYKPLHKSYFPHVMFQIYKIYVE